MSLKDLPNELILEISFLLPTAGDFKWFALANRSLFTFLKPVLFKKFAKRKGNFTIALHLSAESGNEENLRLLLENQRPKVIDASTFLISNNAKVDEIVNIFAKDLSRYVLIDRDYERSPLFWAMVENRGNLFARFLKTGVWVDLFDRKWYTPLYWAVMNESLDTCRLLLRAGATVYGRNFRTQLLPLHAAVIHRSQDLVKLLLEFGPGTVNERGAGDFTPLILALYHSKRETAIVLLKNGADPHSFTADRAAMDLLYQCGTGVYMHSGLRIYTPSPLRYAIMEHELEVLGMILHGKVDSLDVIGATSLQHAASDHDPIVVKFLLGMGASVDYMGDRGYTALMQASASGCCLTIQALLDGGANINARCSKDNRTALHWAVLAGPNAGPSIRKLLENGIDINALDIHQKTAISYAMEVRNFRAFITLFLAETARWEAVRSEAVREGGGTDVV